MRSSVSSLPLMIRHPGVRDARPYPFKIVLFSRVNDLTDDVPMYAGLIVNVGCHDGLQDADPA